MLKTFVYVVAFVTETNRTVSHLDPESVSLWSIVVQAAGDHEAYTLGYREFRLHHTAAILNDLAVEVNRGE